MIGSIRKWFSRPEPVSGEGKVLDNVQFCVAVLLVEVARADFDQSDLEVAKIGEQLAVRFDLPEQETAELLKAAQDKVEDSVSLHEFTQALHAGMSYAEKETVVEMLWHIALADQNLDKYEDYMIGKIAELLYVYRGDVIRLKDRVIQSIRQTGE